MLSGRSNRREENFDELDAHDILKVAIKRFSAQEAELSLTAISSLESARRKFLKTRRISCLESTNQTVLGSAGRSESNSHQLARIGEKKIFHELDVHHVQKVGIKRFRAEEAEMSLRAISSLESARRKFFMNTTYIMSRKWETNVFGIGKPK